MRVLGIETSCDETGIAIYDDELGLMANQLYSQIKVHADYGGVVPELASRDHIRKTVPLIQAALKEANLTREDIDAVAYTAGPGLVGALMVGGNGWPVIGFCMECACGSRSSYGRPFASANARRKKPRISLCSTPCFWWAYPINKRDRGR